MKLLFLDREAIHLLISDLSGDRVAASVQLRSNLQSRLGRRAADQVDDHLTAHQWSASPVLRDVTEHPVLDLVPLACARRKVAHRDAQTDLVDQSLQLNLPQAAAAPVGATAVGRDQ